MQLFVCPTLGTFPTRITILDFIIAIIFCENAKYAAHNFCALFSYVNLVRVNFRGQKISRSALRSNKNLQAINIASLPRYGE
jgi:hypothetical protein